MNASSFERALRDPSAPAPDPAARLSAKQAALDEFARAQAYGATPVERDGSRRSMQRWRHPTLFLRRSTSISCFAGAASACITGLGVLLLWSHSARYYGEGLPPLAVRLLAEPVIEFQLDFPRPSPAPLKLEMIAPASPALEVEPEPILGDRFASFESNPVKRVVEEPVSTFSIDVDTASYSYVRRQLNAGALPQEDAVRAEEMINYFDYSWPAPASPHQPFSATVAVSDSPWAERNKLVHIGIKGYELPEHEQPDVNLVLLIDVSGSMNEPGKLPLVKRSIEMLLPRLKPYDTVAMVVYAGAAGVVLPPTEVRHQQKILGALLALEAGGSTDGGAGIEQAYQLAELHFRQSGVNRILLATDGDFNVGTTSVEELKELVAREREKGIFLSVLGYGQGNYHDALAQALAQNGNGVAAYIDTVSEARKVLVQEATASLFTIAKDVKIQVEFNPTTVSQYRLVGYETRALAREDFEDDTVDAGDIGSGHTVTAIYEITPTEPAARPSDGDVDTYGDLRIRYKHPDGFTSRLIAQPILIDSPALPPSLQRDVEFATSVAGFAQLLRGGAYTGQLTFEDVIRKAQSSRGEDPHGYRAEFVQLVREAQSAKGM